MRSKNWDQDSTLNLDPVIPATIIGMPTINSAIASRKLTSSAPITGAANIVKDKTIYITPAAMLNILDHLPLVLSVAP